VKLDEITEQRERLDEWSWLAKIPGASKIIDGILKRFPKGTSRAEAIKNLTPDELAKIQGVMRGRSGTKIPDEIPKPTERSGIEAPFSKIKRQQDAKIKADSARVKQQQAAQDAKFAAAKKAAERKAEVDKLVKSQAERAAKAKRDLETARKNALKDKVAKADDVVDTTKGTGQVGKVTKKADDVVDTTKGAGQAGKVTKKADDAVDTTKGAGQAVTKTRRSQVVKKVDPKTSYSNRTTSKGGPAKSGGGYSQGKSSKTKAKDAPKVKDASKRSKVNYIKPTSRISRGARLTGVAGALAGANALAGNGQERKSVPLRKMIRSLGTPDSPAVIQFEDSALDEKQLEAMIRNSAKQRGMDPDVAVRVWRSEGGTSYQSNVPRGGKGSEGGREASYGPFQLYTGGGLGNEYEEKYGVDLRDDNTPAGIQRQIDFALDKAVTTGWEPWKGAAKVDIGPRDGLEQAQTYTPKDNTQMATPPNKQPNKIDPDAWVNDLRQGEKEIRQLARDIPKVAKGIYKDELKPFYKDTLAPLGKVVGTVGKEVYNKDIKPVFKKTSDYLNKKWQEYKSSGDGEVKYYDTKQTTNEKAPPGDKYERMVKDIKKGYAKDGKLTDTERGIAYATAWKLYNKHKGKKS